MPTRDSKSRTHSARPTVFPAPDHDHERCSADALAHAETLCAARGQRLTPIRRQVLETLAASH
jgi:Fur family zinc uptake transcriptional regulator